MKSNPISALFLDVGGVLLTNGWDTATRKKAVETFHLDEKEVDKRHRLAFDVYEIGKMTLDDYLKIVIFYESRPFSYTDFKQFMFSQSQPYQDMLDFICEIKTTHRLKIVVVSNEGRELAEYRFKTYRMREFVDVFIVSSFVHLRKPDTDIYKLALDSAQVQPNEVVYIDDRQLLVECGVAVGFQGIWHQNKDTTEKQLKYLLN